jgi:hypothetical protein
MGLLTTGLCEAQTDDEIMVNTRSDLHPTVIFDYWPGRANFPD